MHIIKHLLIAVSLIAIVLVLANVLRPENAIARGSGFTRTVPAVTQPFQLACLLAAVYFGASFFTEGKRLAVCYAAMLAVGLLYLWYCIRTYVESV